MLDPALRWAKTFKLPGMFLLALYLVVKLNHAAQIFLIHDSTATRAITAEKRVCFAYLGYPNDGNETGRKKEEEGHGRNSRHSGTAPKNRERKTHLLEYERERSVIGISMSCSEP